METIMEQYAIDTHPLLWYVSADSRISSKAKAIIERAEAGEIRIIVPAIVLIEAIEVIKKGRVIYDIDELLQQIYQRPNFIIKNLDSDIINLFKNYLSPVPDVKLESHDKIIVVTAQFFDNSPIITKNRNIREIHFTIW